VELTSSQLIERIALLDDKPVILSGYILTSGDDANDSIRLYPSLDPRCYYVFSAQCVVDTMANRGDSPDRVGVLLQPDCEIELVSRMRASAKDLASARSGQLCPCDQPSRDDPDIVFAKKDDLRDRVIRLARMLLRLGVDELNCTRWTTADAACCKAWSKLLDEVGSGGNAFDAANRVLTECVGIG
jgi:hypothetical protein